MIGLIAVVAVLLVAGAIASTGTAAAAAVGTSATAATTKSTTRILREHPTTETRRQTRLNSHNRQPTPPQTQSQLPKKTRDDYLVRGLVEVEPAFADFAGTMYAGLIPTITTPFEEAIDQDETKHQSSSLMFWLFVPDDRPDPNDDTLVVWLNGGPGCSSLGGALFEHGPVTIPLTRAGSMGFADDQKNSTTTDRLGSNPYAWTHATAMLYVEQPVGTGFATDNTINEQNQQSTGVHNETDVGRDFYGFLQNFYDIFDRPEEGSPASETKPAPANTTAWRDKPLYLFGESYAGMYVPSIAHYVYHENKKHNDDKQQQQKPEQQEPSRPPIDVSNPPRSRSMKSRTIPLAGIALGNGWMNALVQGPAVIDYAWWHGMIDTATVHALHQEWDNCQYNFKQEQKQEHHHHHRDDNSNDPSSMRQRERGEPRPFHRFTVPDECGILEAVLAAAGAGAVSWGAPNAYDVTTWDP